VRVTLFGDSICINRRFDPSELNLAYDGLLLGMRSEARKGILVELCLVHCTFASSHQLVPLLVLQEEVDPGDGEAYHSSGGQSRP
jgi:hypothetical protein